MSYPCVCIVCRQTEDDDPQKKWTRAGEFWYRDCVQDGVRVSVHCTVCGLLSSVLLIGIHLSQIFFLLHPCCPCERSSLVLVVCHLIFTTLSHSPPFLTTLSHSPPNLTTLSHSASFLTLSPHLTFPPSPPHTPTLPFPLHTPSPPF